MKYNWQIPKDENKGQLSRATKYHQGEGGEREEEVEEEEERQSAEGAESHPDAGYRAG